ncbi:hypothetical protein ACF8Q9_02165 [Pseudomonas sp. TYF_15]|uniref:hypothetical protein n=1 Tax=Pseudomonas sp. TYF_15 TaxID=3367194 RepID=UPI00370C6772
MDTQDILRAMQRLAREVQAIRRPLDQLIGLAHRGEAVDKAEISNILRREATQRELALNWETILYRHTTGQYVLICTALPDSAKDAQILVTRRLINSREACAFCGLVENSFAPIELTVAKSPVGIPIQSERVHPRCSLYWQRLKLIAGSE